MTSRAFQHGAVFGLLLSSACGGSKERTSSQSEALEISEDTNRAGGESSEFGGTRVYCYAYSREPLDLEDENVAPWVEMAEGHYEVDFTWKRQFLTDVITGFEEKTTASLDVDVIAAYDLDYGSACGGGSRALQLQLEVAFETADGALRGSFPHSVATEPGPSRISGEPLRTYWPRDVESATLDDFSGLLDYGVDRELLAEHSLSVALSFDGSSASGWLAPFVSPRNAANPGAGYSPILGVFSADGCTYAADVALSLDATLSGFVEPTPRALYERATSRWNAGPVAAAWSDGAVTQVTLSAGEPLRVCQAAQHARFAALVVEAPVRLESGDGKLAVDQVIPFLFVAGQTTATADTNWRRPWIPVDQFESMTGIPGVNFDGAEYGGVYIANRFDLAQNTANGSFAIDRWTSVDFSSAADFPTLSW